MHENALMQQDDKRYRHESSTHTLSAGATELPPSDSGNDSSSESVTESSSESLGVTLTSALPSFWGQEVPCKRQHAARSAYDVGNDRGYSE